MGRRVCVVNGVEQPRTFMKYITLLLLTVCSFVVLAADKLFDDSLATNAVAVLRVDHAKPCPVRDGTFDWYTVWPSQVIKNESSQDLHHTFQVAALKGHSGIPDASCTIYLQRYSSDSGGFNSTNGIWVLVCGDATNGVSHISGRIQ
jgi:hypothetical protein